MRILQHRHTICFLMLPLLNFRFADCHLALDTRRFITMQTRRRKSEVALCGQTVDGSKSEGDRIFF